MPPVSEKNTVLIIDDELGPRESLRILLKDFYTVFLATNGDEGLTMLKTHSIDTIILDLRMPGKSGLETLEEIRKINPDVPVIVLTGFGTLEAAQKAVHLNIFEFISKPFDINEMKDCVSRAVEKNRIILSTTSIINQLNNLNTNIEQKIHDLEKFALLGELSAEVLHEINNPLTIILGYVQILMQEMASRNDTTTEETWQYLKVVENEVKRCQTIAKSFFNASKNSFKRTPVSINIIIENMICFFRDNPIAKHVNFFCDFEKDISLILASPEQLQQVFTNLLVNAIEAMDAKGNINIETKNQSKKVVVKISDTGKGMPKELLEKIFQPFFTTKSGKGTGIGLTISKKIIETHGGQIYAESQPEKGTTFILYFPAYEGNA
ncbi:MAG TPA: ATP-binding protein [bacterium]|nr:ATP-binding protein [bacterium]HPP09320.1 ATP-binding protein [bacterium]